MATTETASKALETPVEEKLFALYKLQQIDSEIDKIKTVRGELPLEVQDLGDEVEGLQTRMDKLNDELSDVEQEIADKNNTIKEAKALIKKYEEQQMNVRNSREYDSITKEMEFQALEIQLAEKKIGEFKVAIENKKKIIEDSQVVLTERREEFDHKKSELDTIIKETEKEEKALLKQSGNAEKIIEERLITAYKRIRNSMRNGLAVVAVQRDSCGGCFAAIPPQRQLDLRTRKKIIVCEHCGRILVDPDMGHELSEN